MIKKITVILVILITLQTVQGLRDNFYFTLEPNEERCFTINIPEELLSFKEGFYTVNVTTDLGTNINYIRTEASGENSIDFPLCFNSYGRKESEFSNYRIDFFPSRRSVSGGVCISNISGANMVSGNGSPCDLINGHNELIGIRIVPSPYYTREGPNKILVYLKSSEDLKVEIDIKSDIVKSEKQVILLERNRPKKIELPFNGSKGNYFVNVTSRVIYNRDYCYLPFCVAKDNGEIFINSFHQIGWKVDVPFIIQTLNSPGTAKYVIIIRNFEDERDFELEVLDTPGIKSNIQKNIYKIGKGEDKEIELELTPEKFEPGLKFVDVVIRGDIERRIRLYINMKEVSSDIRRLIRNLNISQEKKDKIASILNYVDGFNPDIYNEISGIIKETDQQDDVDIEDIEEKPLNSLYIVVPLVVVIILLFVLFKRRQEYSSSSYSSS